MNWDIVEGSWKQFRGLVKTQWNEVAHDHHDVIVGTRGELAAKIHKASPQTEGTMKREIRPAGLCCAAHCCLVVAPGCQSHLSAVTQRKMRAQAAPPLRSSGRPRRFCRPSGDQQSVTRKRAIPGPTEGRAEVQRLPEFRRRVEHLQAGRWPGQSRRLVQPVDQEGLSGYVIGARAVAPYSVRLPSAPTPRVLTRF